MEKYLLVMAGGAVGSLLRYIAGSAVTSRYAGRFPWGTFFVNITGSFLIGAIMTFLTNRTAHPNWRFLLVVGFLGGYTTFSSFEYETFTAARTQDYFTAAVYVAGSAVAGLTAVWLGTIVVGRR